MGNTNATTRNANNERALRDAVSSNKLATVRRLIYEQRVNVNAVGGSGRTALIHASNYNRLEVCMLLFESGRVHVNAADDNGQTALHWACNCGQLQVVHYLVHTAGGNTNAVDKFGRPLLYYAVRRLEFVQCLIESGGAQVETADINGENALHVVSRLPITSFPSVQYLVRKWSRSNIDVVEYSTGRSALHWACCEGRLHSVRCLTEEGGASVKLVVATTGETVLHLACAGMLPGNFLCYKRKCDKLGCRREACSRTTEGNNIELIRYLVETCQVDANARDNMGRTALHITASHHCYLRVILYVTSRYPIHAHL
jgi:ankyrin repeat protein